MANQFFPLGFEALIDGSINLETDTIKAYLTRGYTFNSTHKFLSDITGAGGTLVQPTGTLASKTFTLGTFDAADDTFGTPSAGAAIPAIVLAKSTGTNSTSRVLFYMDDAPGLPVTPDGTNPIPIVWNTGGIFSLS